MKALFILCLLCLPFALRAEWRASLHYQLQGRYNSVVKLQGPEAGRSPAETLVDISFRRQGSPRIVMQKSYSLAAGAVPAPQWFQLPPGDYRLRVECFDGQVFAWETDYSCPEADAALQLSDIRLQGSEKPSALWGLSGAGQGSTAFFVEIYANQAGPATLRAVLYREDAGGAGEGALAYASVSQLSRVLTLQDKSTLFNAPLNTDSLPPGRYLLEVLLYRNESLQAERSLRFDVEDGLRARILNDLPAAIRLMEGLLPPARMRALLELPPEAQRAAFLESWQQLYPLDAPQQMEAYFARRFEMGNESADANRIRLLYGEPQRIDSVSHVGKSCLRWRYPDWNLVFLFEEGRLLYALGG